jgi:hypothetical protein
MKEEQRKKIAGNKLKETENYKLKLNKVEKVYLKT